MLSRSATQQNSGLAGHGQLGARALAAPLQDRPRARDTSLARRLARCDPRSVFDRFTAEARQVVVIAQKEARDLRHSHIDTEHLLLGVLSDRRSRASRLLKGFGITAKRARDQIVVLVGRGETPAERMMPFTPAAKKVLSLSLREAMASGSRLVTPEFVLCGLLRVDDGLAVRVLLDLNADPRVIRETLAPLLQIPSPPGPPTPRASQPRPIFIHSDPIVSRLIEVCVERAIDDDRSEYGLGDLLEAITDDPEATAVADTLGVDLRSLRRVKPPEAPKAADG